MRASSRVSVSPGDPGSGRAGELSSGRSFPANAETPSSKPYAAKANILADANRANLMLANVEKPVARLLIFNFTTIPLCVV